MTAGREKIAVVLFNLGGPDGPRAVRPFLENLFSDPAIIGAPWIVRKPLAAFIARSRERAAVANYAVMGGGSPIMPETTRQAEALDVRLALVKNFNVNLDVTDKDYKKFHTQTKIVGMEEVKEQH